MIRYETLQCSSFRLHWLRFGLLTVDSVVLYCGLFRFDTLFSVVVLDVVVVECVELHFGSIRRLWFLFCFVLVVCACGLCLWFVLVFLFCRARPFRAVACLLARARVCVSRAAHRSVWPTASDLGCPRAACFRVPFITMQVSTIITVTIIYVLFGFSEVVMSRYVLGDWAQHGIMGTVHSYVVLVMLS